MMLSAMPETTWLPRLVMQAKPWTMASKIENSGAGGEAEPGGAGDRGGRGGGERRAQHLALEPDVDHARALGEQAGERGEHQRRREPDGRVGEQQDLEEELVHQATASAGAGRANSASTYGRNMCSSAPGEQDHQALDHHDDVAAERRHVERQLGAALVERAEQERGQDDAERMVAAHQRHGDADEAEAAGEVEGQAVLRAHDHVERDQPGERARDGHRQHDLARRRDAAVDRRGLVLADHAERIAVAGLPDEQPDQHAAEQGEHERQVERRAGDLDAERAHELVHLGQPGALRQGRGLGDLLPRRDQHVDQEIGHQRRAAMKLNMIVVITTWLPRRACSQPGMNAQKPPKAAAARIASGTTSARAASPDRGRPG